MSEIAAAQALLEELPDAEALAARLSILSDPRRLRILFCIDAHPGIRSTDIAAAIRANGSTTSHALAVLRDSGWVRAERHGREIRYHLHDPLAREILHRVGVRSDGPAAVSGPAARRASAARRDAAS